MMMTTIPGWAAAQSLETNWGRLHEVTSKIIDALDHSADQREANAEAIRYERMLATLRHDRVFPGKDKEGKDIEVRILGMMRAPGSKNRHHNVEGGLVAHLLQMWELWIDLRPVIHEHIASSQPAHPQLNDMNVWKCILHHDLNKVWKYKLVTDSPWEVDYANEQDRLTIMLGDTNKTLFFLGNAGIKLSPILLNAMITAEGGYATQPRPQTETVLAKVAYLLDEMSANVVDRLRTNRFWDSKAGGISDYIDH